MKNPKMILALVVVLVLVGGAVIALNSNEDATLTNTNDDSSSEIIDSKENEVMVKDGENEVMMKEEDHEGHEEGHDAMMKDENDVMKKDESSSNTSSERFITLASFDANQDSYSDNSKVLFFHASWCSICVGIENEINTDPSRIPSGTTMIKTDYDSETALRQKYGVNNQYTFVQIDNDGNQIAKWSATSLDKALAEVQS